MKQMLMFGNEVLRTQHSVKAEMEAKSMFKDKINRELVRYKLITGRKLEDDYNIWLSQQSYNKYLTLGKRPRGWVYFIGNRENKIVKIGYSRSPKTRLKELQTGCPYKLSIIYLLPGGIKLEKLLHKKYEDYKLNGEWFKLEKQLEKDCIFNRSNLDVYC